MPNKLINIPDALYARIVEYRHDNRFKTEREAILAILERGLPKEPKK